MRFRLLTAVTALSAWLLVAVGGVVRVTESGLGCPHWPLCTARAVPLDQRASANLTDRRSVPIGASTVSIADGTRRS
jgi:heme A synthase